LTKPLAGILDVGVSNMGAPRRMLDLGGFATRLVTNANDFKKLDLVVCPGVSGLDYLICELKRLKILDSLFEAVSGRGLPYLGICAGLQLLTLGSEETKREGLGIIPLKCEKFPSNKERISPHIGWNTVTLNPSFSLREVSNNWKYKAYFLHSYAIKTAFESDLLFQTTNEYEFVSGFKIRNFWAMQFHIEKSQIIGNEILTMIRTEL